MDLDMLVRKIDIEKAMFYLMHTKQKENSYMSHSPYTGR